MKRPKILVVGSFNMDLIGIAPRIPEMGETLMGSELRTAPGGKGSNQAMQCALLGAEVTMIGSVGQDAFGAALLNVHKMAGVDISHVHISDTKATGAALIEVEQGNEGAGNRILVLPGANLELSPRDLSFLEKEIKDYDMVLLQLEISMETNEYVAGLAHKNRVPVMLNPAPAVELSPEFLSHVTYLSPNETEAAALTGLPVPKGEKGVDINGLMQITDRLRAMGAGSVLVTLGDKGSILDGEKELIRKVAIPMEHVVDPTAAGDSFVASFCTALSAGMGENEAMDFATYAAALTVCREGALPSLPDLEHVLKLMDESGYSGDILKFT